MHRLLKKSKRGSTLIELMIVVAIVGILAVLAIYGVRKYIANAKTAEARNSLGQMGKDEATVFTAGTSATASRALCTTPSVSVPTAITKVKGAKYQSDATVGKDWNADV